MEDIGRSKYMLDTRYYEGYEGEGEVKVWSEENGNEDGIVIWIGFFNTILEGCFSSEFQKNGIIECYFNNDGFYDEKWEMKYPHIVLEELKRFNETYISSDFHILKEFIERDEDNNKYIIPFDRNKIDTKRLDTILKLCKKIDTNKRKEYCCMQYSRKCLQAKV